MPPECDICSRYIKDVTKVGTKCNNETVTVANRAGRWFGNEGKYVPVSSFCQGSFRLTSSESRDQQVEQSRQVRIARDLEELKKHQLAEQKRITRQQAVYARRERKAYKRSQRNQPKRR